MHLCCRHVQTFAFRRDDPESVEVGKVVYQLHTEKTNRYSRGELLLGHSTTILDISRVRRGPRCLEQWTSSSPRVTPIRIIIDCDACAQQQA